MLDASKVRGSGPRVNTDLVSLVRYALGMTDELISYPELVDERFKGWLIQQENTGQIFSEDQVNYLQLIKNHLAANLSIVRSDLQGVPFSANGGLLRANQLFGKNIDSLLVELTQELVA